MRLYVIFLLILITGCINNNAKEIIKYDFSSKENWLSLPENITYNVDVFYLYPTVCNSIDSNMCVLTDNKMQNSAKNVMKLQSDAFKNMANIFAPYYTQYDLDIFEYSNYEKMDSDMKKNTQGITDIYLSLDYYFEKLNNGRPFILVSHSQGSAYMLLVLSEYMKKHPKYYKNMIAAYVLGYPVTEKYLSSNPHLKFAKGADDTGVIISYDVQSPDKAGIDVMKTNGRKVINPITYTLEETHVPASSNAGSLNRTDSNITTPGIADAKVDKSLGIVICSTLDESYEIPFHTVFGTGSYHGQVFQLYYMDLKNNAKKRTDNFLKLKK